MANEKLEVTSPNDVVLVTTGPLPPYRANEVFHVSKEDAQRLKDSNAPVRDYSKAKDSGLLPENQEAQSASSAVVDSIVNTSPNQNVTISDGSQKPAAAQATRDGDSAELDQYSQNTHADVSKVGENDIPSVGHDVVNPDGSVTRNGQEVAPASSAAVSTPASPTTYSGSAPASGAADPGSEDNSNDNSSSSGDSSSANK